uniref:Photosystem II reaction center protein Y n=1 Tax=Pseudellipsoidion edaphicum TaxID=1431838 RepID=A0A410D2U5_9STRA|nr:photosystem II protein Y [Pseudellipsoidion edaphicum]QAA12023.1 photosystem II protein Y [Pseudellipsoidion edaphicum]
MDGRILVVFIPVIGAALWVIYNIGRVALQQLRKATR